MTTYLILNLVVMAIILIIIAKWMKKPSRAQVITLVGLLVLTAIFDNVIIGLGIVDYAPDKILGMYIGNAPIEDFFYSLLAVILVPTIWNKIGPSHD